MNSEYKPLDLETFKKMSKEEIKEYGESLPEGYTRDGNGNILTLKDSSGFWYEYTRDERCNVLIYKDSSGYWYENGYDEKGKVLTFNDSDGVDIEYLFWGIGYFLGYDKKTKEYRAGCQTLTYEECEDFYEENKDEYEDSHDIIEVIRKHHERLKDDEQTE